MLNKIRQTIKAIWNLLRFLKKNYGIAYQSQEVINTLRTTNKQQPNLNFLNERLLFTSDAVRFNIKT